MKQTEGRAVSLCALAASSHFMDGNSCELQGFFFFVVAGITSSVIFSAYLIVM